jgi:hypothetical protein
MYVTCMQAYCRNIQYKNLPPAQVTAAPEAQWFPGLPPAGTRPLGDVAVTVRKNGGYGCNLLPLASIIICDVFQHLGGEVEPLREGRKGLWKETVSICILFGRCAWLLYLREVSYIQLRYKEESPYLRGLAYRLRKCWQVW